LGLVFYELIF